MTPFGLKMQQLRHDKAISQRQMAAALGVSAAYLSALEHGRKGVPSFALLQRVIAFFNIIWDEADELMRLAALSHPKVVIDTGHLSAEATRFANQLAAEISHLDAQAIAALSALLADLRHHKQADIK